MPKGEDIDPAEAHSMLETDLPVVALAEALQATGAACLSEILLHAEPACNRAYAWCSRHGTSDLAA